MRYVSLFAGIGGFDLALNRLGHECVYANDFDKYCKITYDKNFGHSNRQNSSFSEENIQNNGISSDFKDNGAKGSSVGNGPNDYDYKRDGLDTTSITEVREQNIPDHDLLVGGFPCQSFSIAGKRKGFDDTRGTLFFDVARIVKAKRPKYLVLENVKGLLSHDKGRTYKIILSTLTELGYDIQSMVLNSKNFGVPQNRERVFIVGHIRGEPRPKVFPITGESREDVAKDNKEDRYIIHNVYGGFGEEKPREFRDYSPTIRTPQGGGHIPSVVTINNPLKGKTDYGWHFEQGVYAKDGITRSLKAGEGSGNKAKVIEDMTIRRLTPIECERLQGFPDNWTEGVSDTQRYKQLGNAVTVNVVYEVAKRL